MGGAEYELEAVDVPVSDSHPDANNPGTKEKQEPYFLRYTSVMGIITQRMIGTGIFITPTTLLGLTHNVGVNFLFWALGGLLSLTASHLYVEFAAILPQLSLTRDGITTTRHLPMNGGELIYFTHVYQKARFFISCIFATLFALVGNSAPNCLLFAYQFLGLCGVDVDASPSDRAKVAGVAIAACFFVCFFHSVWRKWGIILSNYFAFTKILILVLIIIGGFIRKTQPLNASTVFQGIASQEASSGGSYATAFLSVTFAYGGWNQANYVFGEVDLTPRRFRWTVLGSIGVVTTLYLLVNLAFAAVVEVPRGEEIPWEVSFGQDRDFVFSQYLTNVLSIGPQHARQVAQAVLAFSSFGNILVTTFTSARVKLEIAKEGAFFYEKSINVVRPFGFFGFTDRLFELMASHRGVKLDPSKKRQAAYGSIASAPIPALALHFLFSVVLILISLSTDSITAYGTLLAIYSLLIDVTIPSILAVTMLAMFVFNSRMKKRFGTPEVQWRSPQWVNAVCAIVVFLMGCCIFVILWIPHSTGNSAHWSVTPTCAVGVLIIGILYWSGLVHYGQRKEYEVFVVKRCLGVTEIKHRLLALTEALELKWERRETQGEDHEMMRMVTGTERHDET